MKRDPLEGLLGHTGRDPGCDIPLQDSRVSRLHAHLEIAESAATIRDAGSMQGLWIGDQRVQSLELKAGVRIAVGPFMLEVQSEPAGSEAPRSAPATPSLPRSRCRR